MCHFDSPKNGSKMIGSDGIMNGIKPDCVISYTMPVEVDLDECMSPKPFSCRFMHEGR